MVKAKREEVVGGNGWVENAFSMVPSCIPSFSAACPSRNGGDCPAKWTIWENG